MAFISADATISGTNTTVTNVTGGSLTWALVQRSNTQRGTAEIWRAFAPAVLTNASVTATLSQRMAASLTVVTISGADPTGTSGSGAIGATNGTSAATGAPTASLTTTRNNSWVFGVGTDWDKNVARTVGPNQTMVHQYLAPIGDTYWVQRQTAVTPASGTVVTINDTAPTTDRYNLSIAEILPALSSRLGNHHQRQRSHGDPERLYQCHHHRGCLRQLQLQWGAQRNLYGYSQQVGIQLHAHRT